MSNYGKVISSLRKQQGLTQEQLGNLLHVSYQAVSKWENGLAEPSLDTIEQLTEIFNITVADFFAMAQGKAVTKTFKEHTTDFVDAPTVCVAKKNFSNYYVWFLIAGLVMAIFVLVLCVILIPANRSSEQIYNQNEFAIFELRAESDGGSRVGTGFFINNSGLAVTTFSNIEDCFRGEITLSNGQKYNIAKIIGADIKNNLAIIQIDINRSSAVKIGSSRGIKMGDKVYAMTFVNDENKSVIVEGMVYKVEADANGMSSIQTSASISNGSNGGVLFDEQGIVIGVISGLLKVSGVGIDIVNVCIPIERLNEVDRDLDLTLPGFLEKCNTLSFYSDGMVISQKDYISGDTVEKIEDPIRTGYFFDGWYTDLTFRQSFDFSQPLTTETACYAKWTPIQYIVRFHANGAEGTMNDVYIDYDLEYTLPNSAFNMFAYKFAGWGIEGMSKIYSSGETVKNLANTENEVVNLYAVWEMISYSMTFLGNGATSGEASNIVVRYDQTVSLPSNLFERTGYLFEGWLYNNKVYKGSERVSKLSSTEETLVFEAVWEPIKYKVRFVYEGQESYEQEFTYDEPQNLYKNRFTKQYFKFLWWMDNETTEIYYDEDSVLNLTTENNKVIELTARLTEYSYTIRFHKGDEVDLETCVTESYRYSSVVNMRDRFGGKVGYIFQYYEDAAGNVYLGNMSKLTEFDGEIIDLFAVWEEITYTAYYRYEHKGDIQTFLIGTVTYEEEFRLDEPKLSYDGYEFSHYFYGFYSYTFNVGDVASKLTVRDQGTIYIDAVYTPKTFNVLFNGNGATEGNMEPVIATFDSDVIIPENAFIRTGYVFTGWGFNGETYTTQNLGTLIDIYQDSITLNAQWLKNLNGTGTSLDPFRISTVADLGTFAKISQITQYENEYVVLERDIDCEFQKLNPVIFRGIFDGRGYKLINVDYEDIGLFSDNYGYIKNLKIENLVRNLTDADAIDGHISAAGLVYKNRGYIDRCVVTGSITVNTTLPISIAGMVLVNYIDTYLPYPNIYHNFFNKQIQNSYVDIEANVTATSDISSFYFYGVSGGFNDITHNYTIINLSANLLGVDTLYVDVYAKDVDNVKDEHSFSQANVDITATSCTEYTMEQKVAYYTADSSIKLTIGGREVPKLITTTTDTTNLKNKEWMEANLFDEPNVWVYDGTNFPQPSCTFQRVIDTQEEFEALCGRTLYMDYILNCDIDLTNIYNCMIEANFGMFDGNGHTISNFAPPISNNLEYGLFLKNYGTIKNLRLVNVDVSLNAARGGTAGAMVAKNYGLIEACYAEGSVHCDYIKREACVGGMVGRSFGGIVCNSYTNVSISGGIGTDTSEQSYTFYFGGIVGAGTGLVERCYTSGSLGSWGVNADGTHNVYLAGIANGEIVVRDCFTLANITISEKSNAINVAFYMESISQNAENSFAYEWQELDNLGDITYAGTISFTTMCSSEFLSGLNFAEFVDQENLIENSNAVWVFNTEDLPTLWFEIKN